MRLGLFLVVAAWTVLAVCGTPLPGFSVEANAASEVLAYSPNGYRYFKLPSLREQAVIQDAWLSERVNVVLPKLMAKHNVDTWIMSMLEYAEDTTFFSFKAATSFAARRRTLWVFHLLTSPTLKVEQFKLVDNTEQIWTDFQATLARIQPQRILLNINDTLAFSDGLHAGEREILERYMGPELVSKVVKAAELPVEYIATRVTGMNEQFTKLTETVWAMIDEGFSNKVITPGKTTIDDVVWWFRDRIQSLNMTTWFHPSVDVSRYNPAGGKTALQLSGSSVIQRGDMLWCDVGVIGLGLHTDTQHLGYVLREGETKVPEGLERGLFNANRMQDAVTGNMRIGRSGNEILTIAQENVSRMGVSGTIYSHPVGDWGHSAGPLIGYTNIQTRVPVRGDLLVTPRTWFSVELQSTTAVPEWNGQTASFRQEEDIFVGDQDGDVTWAFNRQEVFHLVY